MQRHSTLRSPGRVGALGLAGTLAGVVLFLSAMAIPAGASTHATHSTPATQLPHLRLPHLFPARGQAGQAATAADNLVYHGGPVMQPNSTTYAIFWEPATLQTGAATHVSPTYNSLLTRYFQDVGGNGLYNINTQYYQNAVSPQFIVNSSTLGGTWVDTRAYPASGCVDAMTPGNCLSDAQIQAEVTRAMTANGWTAGPTHLFFVFTSYGEGSCADAVDCAFVIYCAYHSYFTSGGQTVMYANQPYTGTDLNGCGTPASPNNDIDADSTINVTSHEHMEAVTDPHLDAWYDTSGNENGDKCAWNFGTLSYNNGTANELWNGHYYITQMEWNNRGSNCEQTGP